MASEHHKISPRYWVGARRKWSDREKLLGLYLLSCPHRGTEGLYHLPKGYIAADLNWTPRQVDEALKAVVEDGLAMYDEHAEVVLLPKALKRQKPTTPLQIRGAVRTLAQVPDTPLWEPFLRACDEYAPNLAEAIREANESPPPSDPNGHGNTHDEALSNARVGSHISSSNSKLFPPYPQGGRKRDISDWEGTASAWVGEHFPNAASIGAVRTVADLLTGTRREPTPAAIREFASSRPAYASQLGLTDGQAA